MAGKIEYRSAAVEVRGEDDAPRIFMRAISVGETARDRPEVFDELPEQPEGGVLVGRLHPANKAPIMRARLEARDGALVLDELLPNTAAARDLIVEIRNGTLPAASVEFCALADRVVGGVRRIGRSLLTGLALVPQAAYPSSVAEVRRRRRRRARW